MPNRRSFLVTLLAPLCAPVAKYLPRSPDTKYLPKPPEKAPTWALPPRHDPHLRIITSYNGSRMDVIYGYWRDGALSNAEARAAILAHDTQIRGALIVLARNVGRF